MKVLITGGTGFVGSHTTAALVGGGHEVRMLVRSPSKVGPALAPHGIDPPGVVEGDVTNRSSVRAALAGCDAVLHAANVFTFDPGEAEQMAQVNEEGTEIVVGEAAEAGIDPIVHVSSFVALLPAAGAPLDGDSPVGEPPTPYSASKAAAERVARRYQAAGAPVVITHPGSVWGPHDPYVGESASLAISVLRGRLPVTNDGWLPVSDVRDVAAIHTAAMVSGRGPRRYLAVGHDVRFREMIGSIGEVTGRRLGSLPVPAVAGLAVGKAADWVRRVTGADLPISHEPVWLVTNGVPTDSSKARTELGIEFRPLTETLADTIAWLHEAGLVSSRQAGRLARS